MLRCACVCAQVKLVMHEERCKADVKKGREYLTCQVGTRLAEADVQGKGRAVVAGLYHARQDAAGYEARCLLEPEQEKAREAERLKREAKKEALHEWEAVKRAALTEARIEGGALVEAKFWQPAKGVWAAVDAKTEARHFWERGVACEPWGGKLWVDKTRVLEAGAWALQPGKGVGGLKAGGGSAGAAGGGWEWATQSERELMEKVRREAGVEIEMRNTGGAPGGIAENIFNAALEDMCAGSRIVPAKKARVEK